jgi:hypothetical protein
VQRRPDGCRLCRRDLGRIEAARVLNSPVGVEEGIVAAVVEAETEILEREPERRLTDEAPRGVRGGREVARARAVQFPDGAGLIALVDRSDDVCAFVALHALFLFRLRDSVPHVFEDILASDYGPFVNEFMASQPDQVLYLLASEICEREVAKPALI